MSNEMRSDALANAIRYDEIEGEAKNFILESASVVVVRDETGEIVFITREAENDLGYLENELLGETLETLIPEMKRKEHVAYRTAQKGIGVTRQMAHGRVVSARMKDGRERMVTISLKSKYVWNKKIGEKERWTRANLIFAPIEKAMNGSIEK